MADKIVVMHDGIVEQIGAPLELYDRPDNLFVAGFIGSPAMNFVRGKVDATARRLRATEGGAHLPLATAPAGSDGRPWSTASGPSISLADDGAPAEVVVVEPTGSETQVVASSAAQEIICVFRERITVGPGETIHAQARSAAGPSVRRRDRQAALSADDRGPTQTSIPSNRTGRKTSYDHRSPIAAQGRHARWRCRPRWPAPALLDFAKAWAQTRQWKPEAGAKLTHAALEALRGGRRRRLHQDHRRLHQGDRRQGQRSPTRVVRGHPAEGLRGRQYRRRARTWSGACTRCRISSRQVHRRDRRRRLSRQEIRRLGPGAPKPTARSGASGSRIPVAARRRLMNYRISAIEEGGLQEIPEGHAGFLELCQGAEEEQHARPASRSATPRATATAGALVLCGRTAASGRRERQGHHQLAGDREGAGIRQGALRDTSFRARRPGTTRRTTRRSWRASSPHRQRHLDLRRGEERSDASRHRRGHEPRALPVGPVGKPTELQLCFPILVFNFTKYPQACKALIAFMLEAEQLQSVAGGGAQGYLTPAAQGLRQQSGLDGGPEAHAVPRRRQAHAAGRRHRPGRREGGGGDRRLRAGRHVRQLLHRPRGREERDRDRPSARRSASIR